MWSLTSVVESYVDRPHNICTYACQQNCLCGWCEFSAECESFKIPAHAMTKHVTLRNQTLTPTHYLVTVCENGQEIVVLLSPAVAALAERRKTPQDKIGEHIPWFFLCGKFLSRHRVPGHSLRLLLRWLPCRHPHSPPDCVCCLEWREMGNRSYGKGTGMHWCLIKKSRSREEECALWWFWSNDIMRSLVTRGEVTFMLSIEVLVTRIKVFDQWKVR